MANNSLEILSNIMTALYNILKSDRKKLAEFLCGDFENCKYDVLKNMLIEIEDKYTKKINYGSIVEKLLLGDIGIIINKQRAIYELPTRELLIVINFVCDYIGVNIVEEIGAGVGLLSYMMKQYFDDEYNIITTDGKLWMNTQGINYCEISCKKFTDYNQEEYFNDKLMIISWLPDNGIQNLIHLITTIKPKNLVIIGDNLSNTHQKIRLHLANQNYKQLHIPVKQISCADYFKNNIHSIANTCKSSFVFATIDDNINISNMALKIGLELDWCLCVREKKRGYKILVQNAIINKIGSNMSFLINDMIDDESTMNIIKLLSFITETSLIVPLYLKSTNEVMFWYNINKYSNMPFLIVKRSQFCEYMKYCDILNEENGLENLKQQDIIPDWVENINTAKKCLWLDFSDTTKKWKLSFDAMTIKFRQTYGEEEFISYIADVD